MTNTQQPIRLSVGTLGCSCHEPYRHPPVPSHRTNTAPRDARGLLNAFTEGKEEILWLMFC